MREDSGGTDEARFEGAALAIREDTQEISFFSSRFVILSRSSAVGDGQGRTSWATTQSSSAPSPPASFVPRCPRSV